MKKWLEPFSTAWVGVVSHKLRSSLTILGIVIGVGAVIALMSIGKGAEVEVISRIESLGSDLIDIRPGSFMFKGVRGGRVNTLTMEDAEAIAEQVPYINSVAAYYSRALQVIAGGENTNASVNGVTPEYFGVYNLKTTDGIFISEYDYQHGAKIAVLGSEVKDTLFAGADPIGQQMRIERNIVRVVGVLERKGGMPGSPDYAIIIPLTALQQMIAQERTNQGDRVVSGIALTVTDEEQASYVADEITGLLRERHRLSPGVDNDFRIHSMEEMASAVTETIGTMTLLLGAIAAISLLVGGIGVMNIMLVSVLERTREIGIRKALGARERDIWLQFLIEAAFLAFAGGIIGVILGWGISLVVDRMEIMSTVVTADIVILAVSVAVGIGLFFGFYPAWNASRLNPIDALRFE